MDLSQYLGQLNRYLKKRNQTPSHLTNFHRKIAQQLTQLHQSYSRHEKRPTHHYDQLKKGMTCRECDCFLNEMKRIYAICEQCKFKEPITEAVVRCVNEFTFLFPKEKITTNRIHNWCKIIPQQKNHQSHSPR